MASKSLGKISAVLVANPAPWKKGLNESAASLKSWAKSVDGQIRSAQTNARKSFDGILTKFQQLQRALDAGTGTKLSFRGLDVSARQIRDLAASAELVAKPLGNAVRQFQNLSAEVQTGFLPALAKAQRDVAGLEDAIVKNGSATEAQFNRATISVEKTEAAIKRLSQAQSLASGFATGGELAFQDPRLSGSLQSGRNASQRLLEIGGVDAGQLASELGIAAQKAVELRAAVESTKGSEFTGNLSRAEASLLNQLAYLDSLIKKANEFGNVQAASGRLNILEDLSDPPTAATRLPQGFLQGRAESTARQEIGAGVDPAIRQFRQLASQVQSVRSQIDTLPATIGSEFVPRLREAEQAFVRLRTSGRATAEEIENASNEVQQLAAQVRRVSQTQGIASFADGLDDTALRGALGNLQALQQILNRVGATAGSDGARQFDRLRAAIQRATREGTVGSEAFQRELRQITQDAAAAAAATGRIGQSAAFREIQRGGDIARGGFDKLSLATQQAAFAIDDFFSATGDLSQRIRAVQNNVTQLAFILGGTTGLFIGLGVAIAAQAAVALFKWSQNSVEAEDKTQALNEALARQKSLVEEIKQAFDSLGDSLTRGIFDEATERARQFENQIKEIQQRSQELEKERFASLDEDVQRERGFQASRQAMLEQETDPGRRVALQSQIEQSRRREEAAAQRAAAQQAPALDEIRRSVIDGILSQIDAELGSSGVGSDFEFRAAGERARRAFESAGLSSTVSESGAARVDAGSGFSDVFEAASGLQGRIDNIASRIQELDAGFFTADGVFTTASQEREVLDQEITRLSQILQQLESPLREALTNLRLDILDSAQEVSGTLRASGEIIENSLGGLGSLAEDQREIAARIAEVTSELAAGATAGVDGVLGTDDDIALTREEIAAREKSLENFKAWADMNLSATRSTEAFSNALDRVAGDLAGTVVGEAQSAEQQARRDVNRLQAELNTLPADATPRERLDATARLRDAQQRQAELAESADDIAARRRQLTARQNSAVERFQINALRGMLGEELEAQVKARDSIQRRIDAGENVLPADRARLAELNASISDAFENSPVGLELAAEADAIDVRRKEVDAGLQRAQQQAEERQRSVDSGLELLQSPEQTAAQRGLDQFNDAIEGALSAAASSLQGIGPFPELNDGILSLQELGTLFTEFPEAVGGIRDQFFANLQQARDNITGNISAQIAQFDAERSRPSRQALQAQDINTQQGRAELNRLLRGDDANRDQPILQGIKEQTAILKLIDQRIDEVKTTVGVAGA